MRPSVRILLGVAAVLAVVAFVVVVVVNRPGVPQRDYAGEYAELRGERLVLATDGLDAWDELVGFNRYFRANQFGDRALDAAIERAEAAGEDVGSIDRESLAFRVMEFRPAVIEARPGIDPLSDRILSEAREQAAREMLAMNREPGVQAALQRFIEHEFIATDIPESLTLDQRLDAIIRSYIPARTNALFEAMVIKATDDPAERLLALRSVLASARVAAREPMMLSLLTVMALDATADAATLDVIDDPALLIDDPRAWIDAIQWHQALMPDLMRYYKGERLFVLDTIEAEFTKRPGYQTQHAMVTIPVVGVTHGQMYRLANAFYDEVEKALAMRFAERGDASEILDRFARRADFRARPMLDNLMPQVTLVMFLNDRFAAKRAGVLTALAIAAYRQDHAGAPPESLSQLVPNYLDALPDDPFAEAAGVPLVYRVDGDGRVMLYSRGPNLTDDGGKAIEGAFDPNMDGDLVYLPRP